MNRNLPGVRPRAAAYGLAAIALVTAALILPGCSMMETSPPLEIPTYDARTFYETTSVGGGSISPDESKILISSDASGVFNVYAYPVQGGEPTRLTESSTSATFGVDWFPSDERILFTADQEGNELNHLFVREVDGRVRDLTPGENLKATFVGWTEDEKHFFVATNERTPFYFDLYRYEAAPPGSSEYPREMVFENNDGFMPGPISRNGRWMVLGKPHTNADNDLYLLDLNAPDEEPRHITPHEGDVSHGAATFTPDGRDFYYTSDKDSEFMRLWSYNLASGTHELVQEEDWDILGVTFSWDGRYRILAVNEDARTDIRVEDVVSGSRLELPDLDGVEITSVRFSKAGNSLVFATNSDTSPTNLYFMDLQTGDHRKLTETLNPAVDESLLVESEVIRYESFDGLEIPALLYKPKVASRRNKVPALVWVHGGPGGQSRIGYRADLQFLLNHGYAILAVNNRGSSGYGKTFFHLDDRRHGEDDLQDCIYGRNYLEELDWVDEDRIGIIGGSYGGFMVAAAMAFEPRAFDVGINIFGVTNWLRTLTSIPPWWAAARESLYSEMGDPSTDEVRLRRISPLFHADKIERPMLVIQGANDPRVLKVESDEIVDAARANGAPVEYLVFDDEGHGFSKRENRIAAAETMLTFLKKHLAPESQEAGR
jgi:prolyl oligopeptidase